MTSRIAKQLIIATHRQASSDTTYTPRMTPAPQDRWGGKLRDETSSLLRSFMR